MIVFMVHKTSLVYIQILNYFNDILKLINWKPSEFMQYQHYNIQYENIFGQKSEIIFFNQISI